jgi:predicted RNA-binding protein Jag
MTVQSNNKRKELRTGRHPWKFYEYNGKKYTCKQLAELAGIKESTMHMRLVGEGMTVEEAVTLKHNEHRKGDKIQDKYPDWKIKGFYFYFEDKMTSNKIGKLKKLKDTDFYIYIPETDANESMTNEDLDADNLMWKLDKWFETHEEEKNQFTEMISKYNQTVDVKELEKDLKNTPLQDNLKEFVNFMFDDLDFSTEKDYLYQLKKIIEYIKGKKVNF